jgi:hypothetical protein
MTKLRSSIMLVHIRWTPLLQELHHRTSDQEATQPLCRPRSPRPGDITALRCPLPDLAFEAIARFSDSEMDEHYNSSFFFPSSKRLFSSVIVVTCIYLFIRLL